MRIGDADKSGFSNLSHSNKIYFSINKNNGNRPSTYLLTFTDEKSTLKTNNHCPILMTSTKGPHIHFLFGIY